MMLSHEPWLVALSVVVAFQGSYAGLYLARRIRSSAGNAQRMLITGSALTLALGIWTMHFVGLLAVRLPVSVDFLVLPTLLSFLVCVLVVGLAVFEVATRPPSRARSALAALCMGGGIVTMHYLGMYALHASAHMAHDPVWVGASIAISIGASGYALWFGFGSGKDRPLPVTALLMGLAISAMHYTAMAGMTMSFHPEPRAADMPALSPGLLAIVVSVVAFIVSGVFLLTLVPETRVAGDTLAGPAAVDTAAEGATTIAGTATSQPTGASPPSFSLMADAQMSPVAAGPVDDDLAGPLSQPAAAASGRAPARSLPVEKDGRKLQFDVSTLIAVQAQAHYTQLFDGDVTWFCPLPISEVEALLDPEVFARVHRSHIVNLDRVAALRRAGESDVVAMAGEAAYQAPVSRNRRSWLRERLEQRTALPERAALRSQY